MAPDSGKTRKRRRFFRRFLTLAGIILPGVFLLFSCSGCSPVYVARAGLAEWKILSARRPLGDVISDPGTDEGTRRKLLLARQARAFARHVLRLEVGDQYTSYSHLETDTLAWILSAARKDRLEPKTWWFPVVGRVPYRGYASRDAAQKAQRTLEAEEFDTYLRPTSAFSTLGWFSDPILSTFLRYDDVDLVTTVIHELAHVHLWVPGRVSFNESFATFVGAAGAVRFFCGPPGAPSSPECATARHRWEDDQRFSTFLDGFVSRLQSVYDSATLSLEGKLQARTELLQEERAAWEASYPGEASPRITGFLRQPVNNAVLLARMRYARRLPDFNRLLLEEEGDLSAAVIRLTAGVNSVEDPFSLLPPFRERSERGPGGREAPGAGTPSGPR